MAQEVGRDSDGVSMGVRFPRWPSLDGRFYENESPFGGARAEFLDMDLRDEAQGPRSASNGIVFDEVFALKLQNVPD